jgi:hypothetical protein
MATLLAAVLCLPVFGADIPAQSSRPAVYDETADGAKQIADALVVARKENLEPATQRQFASGAEIVWMLWVRGNSLASG